MVSTSNGVLHFCTTYRHAIRFLKKPTIFPYSLQRKYRVVSKTDFQ